MSPAVSRKQQAMFGMADAIKKGKMSPAKSPQAARMAKDMDMNTIREFASTKTANLPQRVKPKKSQKTSNLKPIQPMPMGKMRK